MASAHEPISDYEPVTNLPEIENEYLLLTSERLLATEVGAVYMGQEQLDLESGAAADSGLAGRPSQVLGLRPEADRVGNRARLVGLLRGYRCRHGELARAVRR